MGQAVLTDGEVILYAHIENGESIKTSDFLKCLFHYSK